jgi:hypothetical protein
MTTLIGFHEVDDVQHWLASTIRAEAFASVGATVTEFLDPQGANRVGVLIEAPDVDALMAMLQSPTGAESMQADGVRPETIVLLVKA